MNLLQSSQDGGPSMNRHRSRRRQSKNAVTIRSPRPVHPLSGRQFQYAHRMTSIVESSPEFAILGAGALGSIVGAHLARAGHSVVMLVRERRAQQIRRRLEGQGLVTFEIQVPVLTDTTQLRKAGVLIVAMKTTG